MHTYITTMTSEDGTKIEGPRINAESFEKAEERAKELGVTLDGELMMVSYGND